MKGTKSRGEGNGVWRKAIQEKTISLFFPRIQQEVYPPKIKLPKKEKFPI
jgi:site-specific recombinase